MSEEGGFRDVLRGHEFPVHSLVPGRDIRGLQDRGLPRMPRAHINDAAATPGVHMPYRRADRQKCPVQVDGEYP